MKIGSTAALRACALIAALALVPVIPYAIWGYAGQDFEYHVTSWMGLRSAWLSGHLLPMWDPRANFGMGDTHLGMYPPGAMYAGALLSLLMPLRLVPAVFVWLATALSGATMYWASRDFVAQRDRLAAAALYMLSPYLITTALVRFAAGELLVQVLLPLILLYFYRVVWLDDRRALGLLAVLLGLSALTNVPESVALLYLMTIVAAICCWIQRAVGPMLRVLAAETIAGGVAAGYLAPLWEERSWINQPGLIRIDPSRLLLFMHSAAGAVEPLKLFKYSCWLFACVNLLVLVACWWRRTQPFCDAKAARTWSYLSTVAFFFQLPIALVLWRYLPHMALVAFPFRFLPVMGAAVPLLLLAEGTRRSLRMPAYAVMAALTLVPLLEHARTQATASTRMPGFAELEASWLSRGYEGMPEYVPVGASRPPGPMGLPLARPQSSACAVQDAVLRADGLDFNAQAGTQCPVWLAVYAYPYWRATDETGSPLPTSADRNSLLWVAVPPGNHRVSVVFAPLSITRTISGWVSLAVFLLAIGWWVRAGSTSSQRQSICA
jgi:hypothetical protein